MMKPAKTTPKQAVINFLDTNPGATRMDLIRGIFLAYGINQSDVSTAIAQLVKDQWITKTYDGYLNA